MRRILKHIRKLFNKIFFVDVKPIKPYDRVFHYSDDSIEMKDRFIENGFRFM